MFEWVEVELHCSEVTGVIDVNYFAWAFVIDGCNVTLFFCVIESPYRINRIGSVRETSA